MAIRVFYTVSQVWRYQVRGTDVDTARRAGGRGNASARRWFDDVKEL